MNPHAVGISNLQFSLFLAKNCNNDFRKNDISMMNLIVISRVS